jgi:cytochrome c2
MLARLAPAISISLAASFSLAVAACGSPAEESDEPAGAEATPSEAAAMPGDDAAPGAEPSETPAGEPSATPSPTASPSPGPSGTPSPMAAAASPPEAFKQCAVCHSTEPGKTLIGPSLAGIVGTEAGEVPGFKFSEAMEESELVWNAATLDRYLTDPKAVVPGTAMSFGGVKDNAKRAAIIAYLKTL